MANYLRFFFYGADIFNMYFTPKRLKFSLFILPNIVNKLLKRHLVGKYLKLPIITTVDR